MNALPRHDKFRTDLQRRWWIAGAVSVAAHVAVLVPILAANAPALSIETPATPILIEMIAPPPPPPPAPAPSPEPAEDPAPAGPPAPSPPAGPVKPQPPESPPPPPVRMARRPPPPTVASLAATPGPPQPTFALVGVGQLAGAIRAGAGGTGGGGAGGSGAGQGGGDCDMVSKLQQAVREDPEVRAAVAEAHGVSGAGSRALLIWNGDWIQNPGQEGKGLAGLRQAIAVEVAFAPKACQAEPVRGLVLLTLADAAASPKVALGRGAWTWGDLVERRR